MLHETGIAMVIENTALRLRVNVATLLGIFFSAYLNAVVTAVSPDMIVAFADGSRYYALSWNLFYLLAAVAMPLSGRLSQLLGKKFAYMAGIACCLAGTAYSALVRSMAEFTIARAVIGFGYGSILSTGVAILGEINPAETRAKYVAFYSTMVGLSQAIFPPLAGILAGTVGWRWVFWIGVVIGAVPLLMLQAYMPRPALSRRERVDWWGILLLSLTSAAFVLAVNGPEVLLPGAKAWHCLLAALVLGTAFVLVERGNSGAVIPLSLFKNRLFLVCCAAVFGLYVATYPLNTFKTLLGTGVLCLDSLDNGLLMSVQFVAMTVASVVSGRIVAKTGRLRAVTEAALVVTFLGFAGLIFTKVGTPPFAVGACYACIGAGTGHLVYAFTLFLQNNVPQDEVGMAIGTNGFIQKIGGTIGSSLANLAFTGLWTTLSGARLAQTAGLSDTAGSLLSDYAFLLKEEETTKAACCLADRAEAEMLVRQLRDIFAQSIQRAWLVCAAGIVLCFVMVRFLPKDAPGAKRASS
ncbi:MAG: MFS transporter [Oscillospiraceae bacterium]